MPPADVEKGGKRKPLQGSAYRPCVFHLTDGSEFVADDYRWFSDAPIHEAEAVGNFSSETSFTGPLPVRTIYIPVTSLLFFEPKGAI